MFSQISSEFTFFKNSKFQNISFVGAGRFKISSRAHILFFGVVHLFFLCVSNMFSECFQNVSRMFPVGAQKFNLHPNTRWPHIPYVPHSLSLPRLHLLLLPTPPFLASRTIHKTIQKIIGLPPPTSSNFLRQFPISPNFSKFFQLSLISI